LFNVQIYHKASFSLLLYSSFPNPHKTYPLYNF
jgi:hypothetical protein